MAGIRELKKRIRSIGNISKITKAMEMVSAGKMRQAQLQALSSRHYQRKLEEVLTRIGGQIDTSLHPLLQSKPGNQKALLVISTDRGQTGSLNANLFKTVSNFQQTNHAKIYTIGRLAKEYTIKANFDLVAEFGGIGNKISYEQAQPVSGLLREQFLAGTYSEVHIAYMDFISTLVQKPRITKLLPISNLKKDSTVSSSLSPASKEYLFEPGPLEILNWLLPYWVELTVYQSLLEARASEHSARMVAMKNASDNAAELVSSLTLSYNRSRQANITNELSDITTASLSIAS